MDPAKKIPSARPEGRATVLDVARHAEVGASTVSRYLRGVPVRPRIAGRIAEAVRALAYQPNQMARSLRMGRTRTIGAVLPKTTSTFFSEAAQRMEEEVRQRGCTLLVVTHQDDARQQHEQLLTLQRYCVDGVIFVAVPGTSLAEIEAALPATPVVCFDNVFAPELDAVALRNRESARLATEHLLDHGHSRIACLSGRVDIYSFMERMEGYREAMEHRGLAANFITCSGYEQMRRDLGRALQSPDGPTALLCLSDFVTNSLLQTFEDFAIARDRRPAFIGFDDFGFAPYVDPPLTAVRQPIDQMVHQALELLFARIAGNAVAEAQTVSLQGELILRHSCGCNHRSAF